MAEGKEKKYTKYSLEGHLPKSFPTFWDFLRGHRGATGARIVDAATGEATIDGVVGESPSTLFSYVGSFFLWVFFFLFAWNISKAYKRDPPTVNELTMDTPKDFYAPLPDFALTLSLQPRDFYIANQIRQIKATHGSSMTWKEAGFRAGQKVRSRVREWRPRGRRVGENTQSKDAEGRGRR